MILGAIGIDIELYYDEDSPDSFYEGEGAERPYQEPAFPHTPG